MNENTFEILLKLANKASKTGDIPVSAVVVDKDNEIVSFAFNNRKKTKNVSGHAEINAINKAIKKIKSDNLYNFRIITTLEPCAMCFAAAKQVKIDEIAYILDNDKNDLTRSYALNDESLKLIKIGTKKQTEIIKNMMQKFFINEIR